MLETFAAGSKIAVLTANPRNKYPVYIINEHLGNWDKGIWWSNDSHKPYSNRYWLGYSKKSTKPAVLEGEVKAWESSPYDYADDGICPSCKNDLTQPEQMKWLDDYASCKYCGFCFDCFAEVLDCMCHTPVSTQGGWAYGY
jgi:glutamine amidotransferase